MTLEENSLARRQVRRNFSRHAQEYDRYALVQQRVARQLLQQFPLHQIRPKTLEIGCGTGMLSQQFIARYPHASLVLSDLAHGMSCHVQELFPQCAVIDADASALPFARQSFDLILSSSVYQWVDDLPRAMAEIWRLLRPGGELFLALYGEKTLFELRAAHAETFPDQPSHGQGFPDLAQLHQSLGPGWWIEDLRSEMEIDWHQDVPTLLRALKAIGAQNASRNRARGLVSRQQMASMCSYYEENYAVNGQIPASYEVLYLRARRNGS